MVPATIKGTSAARVSADLPEEGEMGIRDEASRYQPDVAVRHHDERKADQSKQAMATVRPGHDGPETTAQGLLRQGSKPTSAQVAARVARQHIEPESKRIDGNQGRPNSHADASWLSKRVDAVVGEHDRDEDAEGPEVPVHILEHEREP